MSMPRAYNGTPPASPEQLREMVQAALDVEAERGIPADQLLSIFSFETAGSMNPAQPGPETQWGEHFGLIQWGPRGAAREHNVTPDMPVRDQVFAAADYLEARGYRPGMGLENMYAAVLAGNALRTNVGDLHNGGVAQSASHAVANDFGDAIAMASAVLDEYGNPVFGPPMPADYSGPQYANVSNPSRSPYSGDALADAIGSWFPEMAAANPARANAGPSPLAQALTADQRYALSDMSAARPVAPVEPVEIADLSPIGPELSPIANVRVDQAFDTIDPPQSFQVADLSPVATAEAMPMSLDPPPSFDNRIDRGFEVALSSPQNRFDGMIDAIEPIRADFNPIPAGYERQYQQRALEGFDPFSDLTVEPIDLEPIASIDRPTQLAPQGPGVPRPNEPPMSLEPPSRLERITDPRNMGPLAGAVLGSALAGPIVGGFGGYQLGRALTDPHSRTRGFLDGLFGGSFLGNAPDPWTISHGDRVYGGRDQPATLNAVSQSFRDEFAGRQRDEERRGSRGRSGGRSRSQQETLDG